MGKYRDILQAELLALDEIHFELTDGVYPNIPMAINDRKAPLARNDNFHYPLGTTYLTYGFRGVAQIAQEKSKSAVSENAAELYNGISAVYQKIADIFLRAGEKFKSEATADARIRKMADMLIRLGTDKPHTFYEALGAEYMVWMIRCYGGCDIGRMDHHLKPFFEQDIFNGTLTEDEALSYLIDVWNGMDRRRSGDTLTNVMIGGMNEDGNDTSSRLSVLMLKATCRVSGSEPHISVRVHKNMRRDVWDAMLEVQLLGKGQGTLYNDEVVFKGLTLRGYDRKHIAHYTTDGCTEILFDGYSTIDFNHIDAVATFELAMNNGALLPIQKKPVPYFHKNNKAVLYEPDVIVGYQSGVVDKMTTFEEVYEAFMRQYLYQLDVKMEGLKKKHEWQKEKATGSFFMNGSFPTVLESGLGMFEGGLPCDDYMVFSGSITTVADCLSGLKHVVYDLKKYSISQVREALQANFKGFETMQAEMKAAPKFGNNEDAVDMIAADIVKRFCKHTEEYCEKTGFRVLPALIGWRFMNEAYGVAATPDGRNYGDSIAEHYNATPGNAKNGPTSIIMSVAKAPLFRACGVAPVHVTLPSGIFRTKENGITILDSLNSVAVSQGLVFLNVAIYDPDQLRDAKLHPEKYPDLIVRVWGFSARFVELASDMQDHIISRVEKNGK